MIKPTFELIRSIELPGLDYLREDRTLVSGEDCLFILAPDLTILVITEIETGLQFDYWDSETILHSVSTEGERLWDSWNAEDEETALRTVHEWLREVDS